MGRLLEIPNQILLQGSGLSGRAGVDVALMAVQESISNPHICSCAGVTQLTLTDTTLKALNVEVKAKSFDNHGGTFAKWVTTA